MRLLVQLRVFGFGFEQDGNIRSLFHWLTYSEDGRRVGGITGGLGLLHIWDTR